MSTDTDRWRELKERERLLKEAADSIKVQEKDLPRVVARFKREIKELDEKME